MQSCVKISELSLAWDAVWETSYGCSRERLVRTKEKIKDILQTGLSFEKDQRVLDGGCGNGINLILLEKIFQVSTFGIDISKKALSVAKINIANSKSKAVLKPGDVRSIPFANNTFNIVMSWGVIEHFSDYELAIEEFHRVLRPNGTLNLIQPNKFSLRHLKKFYLELTNRWKFGMQINFSPNFLCSLLQRKGFQNVRFVVKPYLQSSGMINSTDVWLNKINKHCGYYLYILADKKY